MQHNELPSRTYSSCLTAKIDIKQVIADLKEIKYEGDGASIEEIEAEAMYQMQGKCKLTEKNIVVVITKMLEAARETAYKLGE